MKKALLLFVVILGCGIFLRCGPGSKQVLLDSANNPTSLSAGSTITNKTADGDTGNCKVTANITFEGEGGGLNSFKTTNKDGCDYSMDVRPPKEGNNSRGCANIILWLPDNCNCKPPKWDPPAYDESGNENPKKGFVRVCSVARGETYYASITCPTSETCRTGLSYKVCIHISY